MFSSKPLQKRDSATLGETLGSKNVVKTVVACAGLRAGAIQCAQMLIT